MIIDADCAPITTRLSNPRSPSSSFLEFLPISATLLIHFLFSLSLFSFVELEERQDRSNDTLDGAHRIFFSHPAFNRGFSTPPGYQKAYMKRQYLLDLTERLLLLLLLL